MVVGLISGRLLSRPEAVWGRRLAGPCLVNAAQLGQARGALPVASLRDGRLDVTAQFFQPQQQVLLVTTLLSNRMQREPSPLLSGIECHDLSSCQTESSLTVTFTIRSCLSQHFCQTESNVNRHLFYQVLSVTTEAPVKQKATWTVDFTVRYWLSRPLFCQRESNVNRHLYYQVLLVTTLILSNR